jgi:hypothetical protein
MRNEAEQIKTAVLAGAADDINIALTGIVTTDAIKSVLAIENNNLGLHQAVVTGPNATTVTVTGILAASSVLVSVVGIDGDAALLADSVIDGTANYTITDDDELTGDADHSAYRLIVTWRDTVTPLDITSHFSITSDGNIQSDVDYTGKTLVVQWWDKSAG